MRRHRGTHLQYSHPGAIAYDVVGGKTRSRQPTLPRWRPPFGNLTESCDRTNDRSTFITQQRGGTSNFFAVLPADNFLVFIVQAIIQYLQERDLETCQLR